MPPKGTPKLTHFLCLPLLTQSSTPQWQKSLQQFANDATNPFQTSPNSAATSNGKDSRTEPSPAIPSKAIRPLGALHLTIGVMSLQTEEKLNAATALLEGLDITNLLPTARKSESDLEAETAQDSVATSSEGPSPLLLSFTALQSMHSPKSTTFLYVPPADHTGRLYPFCQALKARFTQEGLMVEEMREMKLHATVLNTLYAGKVWSKMKAPMGAEKPPQDDDASRIDEFHQADTARDGQDYPENSAGTTPLTGEPQVQNGSRSEPFSPSESKPTAKKKKQVLRFDARSLLTKYATFEWAKDVRIEKLAICEMGAKKILDEHGTIIGEQYKEVACVALP
ncbi:MAG: hypothetical protein LQ352_005418 [Teloschistes flavicans]|nr:MAG: hypothetical protein LQ352_005418 [Teloschistes flavicans]